MSEENTPFFSVSVKNNEDVHRLTERLLDVTRIALVVLWGLAAGFGLLALQKSFKKKEQR